MHRSFAALRMTSKETFPSGLGAGFELVDDSGSRIRFRRRLLRSVIPNGDAPICERPGFWGVSSRARMRPEVRPVLANLSHPSRGTCIFHGCRRQNRRLLLNVIPSGDAPTSERPGLPRTRRIAVEEPAFSMIIASLQEQCSFLDSDAACVAKAATPIAAFSLGMTLVGSLFPESVQASSLSMIPQAESVFTAAFCGVSFRTEMRRYVSGWFFGGVSSRARMRPDVRPVLANLSHPSRGTRIFHDYRVTQGTMQLPRLGRGMRRKGGDAYPTSARHWQMWARRLRQSALEARHTLAQQFTAGYALPTIRQNRAGR